jgi:nicotinamidase-related amidase
MRQQIQIDEERSLEDCAAAFTPVSPAAILRKKEPLLVRSEREKPRLTGNGVRAYGKPWYSRETRTHVKLPMSMSSTDKGLLTPENCAVVFLDHQPQMFSVLRGQERQELLDRLLVLVRAVHIFGVPVILTTVVSKEFSGELIPQLRGHFPDQALLKRSSLNAWDDPRFVTAVKHTGRRNFLLAALWSEACLTFPALQMLEEGYGIYVVKDASCGIRRTAHETALRRIEQAGGVSLTALQVVLELQRDWAKSDHHEEVMALLKPCCRMDPQEAGFVATTAGSAPVGQRRNARRGTAKQTEFNQPAPSMPRPEPK